MAYEQPGKAREGGRRPIQTQGGSRENIFGDEQLAQQAAQEEEWQQFQEWQRQQRQRQQQQQQWEPEQQAYQIQQQQAPSPAEREAQAQAEADAYAQAQEQQFFQQQQRPPPQQQQQLRQQQQQQQQQLRRQQQQQQQPPPPQPPQRDPSPRFARPSRTSRSDATSRSTNSQPAGKPTHRGERALGRPRAQTPVQLDSAGVAGALRDPPPGSGPTPSPEVEQARARARARHGEFVEPTMDLQRYAEARTRHQSTPYAGTCTRCDGDGRNPLVDPATAARSPPMTTTSQAAHAAAQEAAAREEPPLPPNSAGGGRTKRTSFGEAFVRSDGHTFVRAGQLAEAVGSTSQAASRHAGAHMSAPYGVTPANTNAGRMSYSTTTAAGHGEQHWDGAADSMAGRIAKRRLQGRARVPSGGNESGTLSVHSLN